MILLYVYVGDSQVLEGATGFASLVRPLGIYWAGLAWAGLAWAGLAAAGSGGGAWR